MGLHKQTGLPAPLGSKAIACPQLLLMHRGRPEEEEATDAGAKEATDAGATEVKAEREAPKVAEAAAGAPAR